MLAGAWEWQPLVKQLSGPLVVPTASLYTLVPGPLVPNSLSPSVQTSGLATVFLLHAILLELCPQGLGGLSDYLVH